MTRPFRVGLNASLLAGASLRGWNRYLVNLLAGLADLDVELFLYSQSALHPDHFEALPPRVQVRTSPPMRYPLWEEHWLPRRCQDDRLDVFHSPYHYGLPYRARCACVLTLHDAIGYPMRPLDVLRSPQVWAYHAMARARADHIVTVSEYSKSDLVRKFAIPDAKITVTYEAAVAVFHQATEADAAQVRRKYGLAPDYVLYYGGWEERKNLPFLLRALASTRERNQRLVLAGGNDSQNERIAAAARSAGVADRVRILGWLQDRELAGLCRGALCLAYPSRHEGFGLQVCEALAAGCPAFVARATSLPEVVGDEECTFSLDDTADLCRLLDRIASDSAWRAALVDRARRRSHLFSWRRTAEQTLEVYASALAARHGVAEIPDSVMRPAP